MAVRSLKNSTLENFANYSSSMNAGYSFQDFELIESVFLASNTSSVTFNNLNQYATEYKHLQVRWVARSNYTAFNRSDMAGRFNGDTGNNYAYHALTATGSGSPGSGGENSKNFMYFGSYSSNLDTANSFGVGVVDFLDVFSSTKNKTTKGLGGRMGSASPYAVGVYGSLWINTSPVTSITFYDLGGFNFIAGSRFTLYGIR